MERHDFRAKRTAHFVSLANGSTVSFSFREFYVWSKMLSSRTEAAHQSAHFLTQEVSMNQSLMDPKLIVLAGRGDSGRRRAGSALYPKTQN
jgi:hypothetical protein